MQIKTVNEEVSDYAVRVVYYSDDNTNVEHNLYVEYVSVSDDVSELVKQRALITQGDVGEMYAEFRLKSVSTEANEIVSDITQQLTNAIPSQIYIKRIEITEISNN
ncbi:MAG: hypothetical protein J6D26_05400 [Clostridia bacterium]|nr:hypothetical protein [Clostridia bacterium]